jgi:uncharacterized protein (TIGR00369 family)
MDKIIKILHEIFGEEVSIEDIMKREINFSDDFIMEKILQLLRIVYLDIMPFNKHIGIKIDSLTMDEVKLRIDMKPELVGNSEQNILHGGVISAVIDQTGGMIAQSSTMRLLGNCLVEDLAGRISKISTIDMRVDYLRPGAGDYFITTGSLVRTGNKVVVVKMELVNNEDVLIAIGTATYLIR